MEKMKSGTKRWMVKVEYDDGDGSYDDQLLRDAVIDTDEPVVEFLRLIKAEALTIGGPAERELDRLHAYIYWPNPEFEPRKKKEAVGG